MTPPRLILVGKVAGPFGVRGELRLTAYTAEPEALLRYGPLLNEAGAPVLTPASCRPDKGALIVRAPEVPDRTAAEALKGVRLYVPREALPPTEEDEFYLADLIGLVAVSPQGEALGKVKAVHDFGAGDILEIDPGEGRPTWLVAFTRQAVPTVDMSAGRVVVDPPIEDIADGEADGPR